MLRVAAIGSGFFAHFHYDAWQRIEGVEVVGLASLDEAQGREVAIKFGVPAAFTNVDKLLDELKPDLVDIITPPESHLELVKKCAARKLNTICQKPLAPTLAEAEELVATASAAGIDLIVHENFRFQPWYREIKRWIDDGRLGDLHCISFRLRPGDGQGPRAYLDRQPYFQKMERLLIHETAVHWVDTFRFLMGRVTAVTARLRRMNPVIAGEDAGYVIFEFANGSTGLFDGNRLNDHQAKIKRLTMGEAWVEGSAGVMRLDGFGQLWFAPHGGNEEQVPLNCDRESFGGSFGGDCVYNLQSHVIEHYRNGRPLENLGPDYLNVYRIEEAIYRSSTEGRRIDL
jgi:predicted dehydrogenase